MPLNNEEKIIFLSSRLTPSNQDIEDIIHLLNSNPKTDYKKLIPLASLNGVAPLLYKNIKDLGIAPECLPLFDSWKSDQCQRAVVRFRRAEK